MLRQGGRAECGNRTRVKQGDGMLPIHFLRGYVEAVTSVIRGGGTSHRADAVDLDPTSPRELSVHFLLRLHRIQLQ